MENIKERIEPSSRKAGLYKRSLLLLLGELAVDNDQSIHFEAHLVSAQDFSRE
ncbi:hypothetical protein [Atrimonas thermophila]|jgi:hypothetical protein|uniref:hypothetical protein n=1 Tax=Atrimonas thermophila TaxID=3064161 RepID=UPI00399CB966